MLQATETRLVGIYFLFKQRSSDLCLSNEENRLPLAGHPNILRADVSDEETSPAMIR